MTKQSRYIYILIFIMVLPIVSADLLGWSDDLRIVFNNETSTLQEPVLASDLSGNLHVVWWDDREGDKEIYYKKLDNRGNNLTGDIRVSFASGESWMPAVATDDNGNVHITWVDNREGNYEIYYKKLDGNNGNSLTVEIRLTHDREVSWFPSITASSGSNADIHIVWQDTRNGNGDVFYTRLNNNGLTLTDDTAITTSTIDSASPALAADVLNNVHIVWSERSEIFYKKLNFVGSPLTPNIQITNDPAGSSSPQVETDALGNVHVVWGEERDGNNEVYYKKLNNQGMNLTHDIRQSFSTGNSNDPVLAVDTSGNVHIAWQQDFGERNWEIFYKRLNNNGINTTNEIRLTNAAQESWLPSIATDHNNNAHLVWQDNRNGNSASYHWEIYYKRSIPLPRISVEGEQVIGGNIAISLIDSFNSNKSYALGMSVSNNSGIPLSDGRIIPLDFDIVLLQSIQNPASLGLLNAQGRLDANGSAIVRFSIPNIRELVGQTVYTSFIVIDPQQPLPQAVRSISPATSITFISDRLQYAVDNFTAALWHFNEGNGSATYDATSNHNDGMLQNGTVFTRNHAPLMNNTYAVHFDGIDDSIRVADSSSLDITDQITVEAWVYVTDECPNPTCTQRVVSKWQTSNWLTGRSYLLQLGNGFDPDLRMQPGCHLRDSNQEQWGGIAQDRILPNRWTHIACAYNGTNIMIYVNGILKADFTQFPAFFTIANSVTNVGIGADVDDPDQYNFAGYIDEVRISNKARDPSEFHAP